MTSMTIQKALEIALEHHRAGNLSQAESIYRQILVRDPGNPDALHLLGMIAYRAGQHAAAAELIQRAIQAQPNSAEMHSNLGLAEAGLGRIEEAIAQQKAALRLKPDFAEAHCALGLALQKQGKLDKAISAYRAAIAHKPKFSDAWNNLGSALQLQNSFEHAIAAYREGLKLAPDDRDILDNLSEAHYRLGNALLEQRRFNEARDAFAVATRLKPDFLEAHNNLADALKELGDLDAALAQCQIALRLNPAIAQVQNNLGNIMKDRGDLDAAIAAYQTAIRLAPDFFQAHNNLGSAFKAQGRLDEAMECYRRAIELRPDLAGLGSNLLYLLHFHPDYDARQIYDQHVRWAARHADPLRLAAAVYENAREPDRRLRIGYVSADFRHHPVGRFLLPLFQNHDHRNFEIVCYADVARPDSLTEQLRQQADSWHDVRGFSDERLAVQIRQDRVDILIDLGAHMSRNRLLVFARKPAPVQVTYLAYCSTTGMKAIDYRLSDPQLDPDKDCDAHYSERTIRLPRTYWCYQPPADAPEVADASPMDGSGCVTFGCFNNFAKVSPPTIAAWARIMRAVANSRLIIHAHEGSHRQRVRDVLAANGVEHSRVGFQGLVPTREYLAQYSTIDIALDPFPYNGGTTTCDALWMGVPVVTLAGNTAVARAGKTLLLNVGLAELVAGSRDEYVDIAAKLAADAERLRALRTTMRDRMSHSPLMDSAQFAAGLENAYRTIWRRWCES